MTGYMDVTSTAEKRRPALLVGTVTDSGVLLTNALRLLVRHGPALLALYLAGILARELILRAAVRLSLVSSELAMLVLLLAPIAVLTALVLMLLVTRPSLALVARPGSAPSSVFTHLGSVLIPFVGVYQWEGDLNADVRDYNTRVLSDYTEQLAVNLADSVLSETEYEAPVDVIDRLPLSLSSGLIAVAAVAFAGRWLLSRPMLAERHRWLAVPGAYLEVVWIVVALIIVLGEARSWFADWFSTRQAVHSVQSAWDSIGFSTPWLDHLLGRADQVIALPLAWLAVGAVVLGHQADLVPSSPPEAMVRSELYGRARSRWHAVPGVARWAIGRLTKDLRERFAPLWRSIRLLVRAGIAPMLLFCLGFVAVKTLAYWLWELQRLAIGPQDPESVWFPLAWPLAALNRAVSYVVLLCLLAAAIDRAVRATDAPTDQRISNWA